MGKVSSMSDKIKAYACYNIDEETRYLSSSGGIFSVLAEYWLDLESELMKSEYDDGVLNHEKNVVYGVAMTQDCYGAEYIRVTKSTELYKLRGSKYMQATLGNTFRQVKCDLEEGKRVLFSGTGCVINGLRKYLQKEYDTFLCVDIICHGVPSPALWKKYVKEYENKNGKLVNVNFRCKKNGWSNYGIKKDQMIVSKDKDSFMQMFLRDYCLRPSCYECKAKKIKEADLTIADFWGIGRVVPEMNDEKGTSLVLIRTTKGERIFAQLKACLTMKEVCYVDAVRYNSAEYKSVTRPIQRDCFFIDMQSMEFGELKKKYASPIPLSFMKKIIRKVKVFYKVVMCRISQGY